MSHPHWPQPLYLFRPRHAGPVPAGPQLAGFAGYSYGSALAGGGRRYGSLSPKYDWATPGYVRAEPSGLGCGPACGMGRFGEPEEVLPEFLYATGTATLPTTFTNSQCLAALRERIVELADYLRQQMKIPDFVWSMVSGSIKSKLQSLDNAIFVKLANNLQAAGGRVAFVDAIQSDWATILSKLGGDFANYGANVDPSVAAGWIYDWAVGKLHECVGGGGAPGSGGSADICQTWPGAPGCPPLPGVGGATSAGAGVTEVVLPNGQKYTLPAGATPIGVCIKPECPGVADGFYFKAANGALYCVWPDGVARGVLDPASVAAYNQAVNTGALRTPQFRVVAPRPGLLPTGGLASGGAGMALALAAGAVVLFKLMGK